MVKDAIYIKDNDQDEAIVCDICLDGDEQEADDVTFDKIVICENCNVAVHQSCYGREIQIEVPVDEWYCCRC